MTVRPILSAVPVDDAYPAIYFQTIADMGIDPVVGPDLLIAPSPKKTPAQRRRTTKTAGKTASRAVKAVTNA